ncbi:hypothetical protein PoB_003018900 [Plakobranchus ocellatus]|uniref:Uncharacterized protein n=1 Tax=Plakobranchus ocellatus TaxID=259542 RepID=A0AAV4AB52_9GAST|nr:hypothetical protein PoB_003018900 [Plakobranchus ocellatus]
MKEKKTKSSSGASVFYDDVVRAVYGQGRFAEGECHEAGHILVVFYFQVRLYTGRLWLASERALPQSIFCNLSLFTEKPSHKNKGSDYAFSVALSDDASVLLRAELTRV